MSMTKNKEYQQEYSFSLKKVQLVEKTLTAIPKRENEKDYDFDIALNITLDPEKRASIHLLSVSVKTKVSNKKLGSVAIFCFFDITNFEDVVVNDQNGQTLPQALINLLNTVVIGTMRGVMYSEFRGTVLDNVLLPVLDPRRFEKQQELS